MGNISINKTYWFARSRNRGTSYSQENYWERKSPKNTIKS